MYNFQRFKKIGRKLSNYTISFNKSLSFGFNSAFYVKENIATYARVVLYFDVDNTAVAFKFVNDKNSEGSFAIIHAKSGRTGSVSCRSFMQEYGLTEPEYFGKKEPKKINYDNEILYVIDLNKKK